MPDRSRDLLARSLPPRVRDDVFLPARQDLRVDRMRRVGRGWTGLTRRVAYPIALLRLWCACWRLALADTLFHDDRPSTGDMLMTFLVQLRQAARTLGRQPLFSAAVVLTLALGVGANTAVFAVVEAVLLRPLPYPDAESLVLLQHRDERTGITKEFIAIGDYVDMSVRQRSLDDLAAYGGGSLTMSGQGEPVSLHALAAGPGLLEILGVRAVRGRLLETADAGQGAAPVAMISEELWRTTFAGDDGVIGRRVRLGQQDRQIVGIAPARFQFPAGTRTDVIVPMALPPAAPPQRKSGWVLAVGRMPAAGSAEQVSRDLHTLSEALEHEFPAENQGSRYFAAPMRDVLVGETRRPLLLLAGAVGVVLLIACVNVGNLLLARGLARQQEMTLRAALGAGRWRLVSQVFAESLVLAIAGGLAGVSAAYAGLPALIAQVPPDVMAPAIADVGINGRVLAVALGVSLFTAALFSLVASLTIRSRQLGTGLTSTRVASHAGARRAAAALVATEIALAVILLIGAGLLLRSFSNLLAVDPGFNPSNVLSVSIGLPADRYPTPGSRAAFYDRAFAAMRATTGVVAGGAAAVTPLTGNNWTVGFERADRPLPAGQRPPDVGWQVASAGYFDALQIPLRAGRLFRPSDASGPPVVIISESIAREFFPGENAVGRFMRQDTQNAEIVGVVGDVRRAALTDRPRQDLYMAFERQPSLGPTLFLRTTSDPIASAPAVRAALRALEPNLLMGPMRSMDEVRAISVGSTTFALWLLGLFAVIAVVLAVVGVYGVMSYSVRQRTREFGTRLALGATRRDIVWMVLRQGGTIALVGLAAGVLLGLAAAQSLSAMLHDVSAIDPQALGGAVALLALASLAACYVPAVRAARLDAARALAD